MKSSLFTLLILLATASFSQDEIMLMSGKVLSGKIIKADTSGITYEYIKKEKKKTVVLDHYRIYSAKYADGKELIYYEKDSIMGRKYSVKEMGYFVRGEGAAYKHHKTVAPLVYGFVIGGASGYLLPIIVAIPVPIAASFGTLIPRFKIDKNKFQDQGVLKEESFIKGYHRVIKAKRLNNALLGGAVGVVTGTIINIATR